MKMIEMLKRRNRTLLEVNTAEVLWALAIMAAGLLCPLESWGLPRLDWCMCVCTAAALNIVSLLHMHRGLERALDFDSGTANKLAVRGYLIRYLSFGVILVLVVETGIMNPVVFGLGYILLMKVAVYSQPFTHKLYNKLFHETDPIPEPLVEEIPEAGNS
ncbi:MAG: ATP synthase subunit I [Butyrivibrio sp.]|nr:ATP synthase subunit I [Butyrivibrio sp.]